MLLLGMIWYVQNQPCLTVSVMLFVCSGDDKVVYLPCLATLWSISGLRTVNWQPVDGSSLVSDHAFITLQAGRGSARKVLVWNNSVGCKDFLIFLVYWSSFCLASAESLHGQWALVFSFNDILAERLYEITVSDIFSVTILLFDVCFQQ